MGDRRNTGESRAMRFGKYGEEEPFSTAKRRAIMLWRSQSGIRELPIFRVIRSVADEDLAEKITRLGNGFRGNIALRQRSLHIETTSAGHYVRILNQLKDPSYAEIAARAYVGHVFHDAPSIRIARVGVEAAISGKKLHFVTAYPQERDAFDIWNQHDMLRVNCFGLKPLSEADYISPGIVLAVSSKRRVANDFARLLHRRGEITGSTVEMLPAVMTPATTVN